MRCPNCHTKIHNGSIFCMNCGVPISRSNYDWIQAVIAVYVAIIMFFAIQIGVLDSSTLGSFPIIHLLLLFAICYFLRRKWAILSACLFGVFLIAGFGIIDFHYNLYVGYASYIYRMLISLSSILIAIILSSFRQRFADKTIAMSFAVVLSSIIEMCFQFLGQIYIFRPILYGNYLFGNRIIDGMVADLRGELEFLGRTLSGIEFSMECVMGSVICAIGCLCCGIIVTVIYLLVNKIFPNFIDKLR